MESICAIKDIYKALYQFEKTFAEVHDITINEAMLLCCLKDGETKSAGMICGKEKIQQMMNAELCFDGLFEKLKTCMEKG